MLRCLSRCLWYQFKDVKEKAIFEKFCNAKLQQGVHPSDVDMEELARESGIVPPSSVNVVDFVREKEMVQEMLQEQRLRRIARREAFLEWQAGQREKGAAHRLARQSRKAEKYKRRHYHATSGRMLPLLLSPGEAPPEPRMPASAPKSRALPTEFLGGRLHEKWYAVPLSLGRK
ncbi:hypothetical protein LSCM1_05997 [Leishmania martiniquensis]|uniref:Uncharacterized protein n=1 Tax=Leishmania martiniquensis TaxID=1580590 RepID=A0A836KQ23_9TRYP|nr:hypothetical protein LSCM1_05997 [Leishmania martiniquensis]